MALSGCHPLVDSSSVDNCDGATLANHDVAVCIAAGLAFRRYGDQEERLLAWYLLGCGLAVPLRWNASGVDAKADKPISANRKQRVELKPAIFTNRMDMPTRYMKHLILLVLLAFWCQACADNATNSGVKWHPGHYVLLYPKQDEPYYFNSVLNDLKTNPGFRGVQKKYFWNRLETQYGVYDFSEIRTDLTSLAGINKYLVLTVQAESFITSEKLVPSYLLTEEYEGGVYPINTGKGFNVAYYNTKVQDRLMALVEALGKEFDSHPNLEAINFEETSPSRVEPEWHSAYIKNYIDGMLRVAVSAKKYFPRTVIIQYVNYPETSLPLVVSTLQSSGIGMGGPDVYQNNKSLALGVYPYYPKISGAIPIGMAVDYHNYQSSFGGDGPFDEPSIASIHQFAVDKLKPNYMFWLRRTKEPSNGSDYWQDVLDYFKNFDWQSDTSGGLNPDCPSTIAPCNTN